jgi:phosphate transport system substrate-binding protein
MSVRRALQNWAPSFFACAGVLLAGIALPQASAQDDIAQQPYVPQHLTVPANRPYVVGPDTVFVAGNDVLIPLFNKLDARWAELEPNVKFKKIMFHLVSGGSRFGEVGFRAYWPRKPAARS